MNRFLGIAIVALGLAPFTAPAQSVVTRLTSAGAVADDRHVSIPGGEEGQPVPNGVAILRFLDIHFAQAVEPFGE